MADIQKTIEIIFNATDQTGTGFKSVGSSVSGFADNVGKATQPLADFTTSLLKTEAAIAAVGVAALAFAFNESVKYESALLDLQKVMGEGEGNAVDYSARIDELSYKFGVVGTEVISSAANFKQAGFDIEESFQLVESALTAVNIAELSTEQASSLLISTLRGFGAGAEDATRVLDIWNEVSNRYATGADELAIGLAALSPVARSAGLSIEETAGVITPIIEVFRSGSEAANAMKTGLVKLADPTKETRDALKGLGIEVLNQDQSLKSVSEILTELGGKWSSLTSDQQFNTAAVIFGANQAGRMSAVLGEWARASEITTVALNSQGSALKELEIRLQAAEVKINILKVAFINASTAVGNQYRTQTVEVVDASTNLLRSFTDVVNSGGLKPLFDLLRPLLEEFANNINKVADNLPAAFKNLNFDGVVDALKQIGDSFDYLFDGVDLTTPEGLTRALQFVVDTAESFIRVTAGMVEGFKPFLDLLKEAVIAFNESDDEAKAFGGELLSLATGINKLVGILAGLGNMLEGIGAIILSLGSVKIAAGILPHLGTLGEKVGLLTIGLEGLALKLLKVGGAFTAGWAVGEIANEITPVQGWIADLVDEWTGLNDEVEAALAPNVAVTNALKEQGQEVKNTTDALKEKKAATEGDTAATEKSAAAQDKIIGYLKDTKDAVKGATIVLEDHGKVAEITAGELTTVKEEQKGWVETIENGVPTFKQTEESLQKYQAGLKKTGDQTKITKNETDEFRIAMEEIASNERIKTLEFAVDFQIAKVEADAQKVVATLDSITETITSTNDLIAELSTSEAPEWDRFGFNIRKQVEAALDRVTESHEKQMELVDAQIEYMKAQTEAIENGEALIKIEADGLEPELEAFMWRILDKLRVQMAQNYSDYLLGNGCGA